MSKLGIDGFDFRYTGIDDDYHELSIVVACSITTYAGSLAVRRSFPSGIKRMFSGGKRLSAIAEAVNDESYIGEKLAS